VYEPAGRRTASGFWQMGGRGNSRRDDIAAGRCRLGTGPQLPDDAFQAGGDGGAPQYIGGAPPAGSGPHHYYLTVTGLDIAKTGLARNH